MQSPRMSQRRFLVACLGVCMCSLMLACASTEAPSLYVRLGGAKGLPRLVDRVVNRAAQDPRTQRSFEGVPLASVKQKMTVQLCALTGGRCTYGGETMAQVHKHLKIQGAEFDALMDIWREELDQAELGTAAKVQLLKLLAAMKRDNVQ